MWVPHTPYLPRFLNGILLEERPGRRDSCDLEETFIIPQPVSLPLPTLPHQGCSDLGHSQPQD